MSNAISTTQQNGVMTVTFDRPEIRNPLSLSVIDELMHILTEIPIKADISRIVFTGVGNVFASGADLREIEGLKNSNAADFARRGQQMMKMISSLPIPAVAAINGFCFGGALDLALACDIRIAAPHASFCHPGAGLGIITGWGGTQRLPGLIGQGAALEMFFTAAAIDSKRARFIGLVDRIDDSPAVFAQNAVIAGDCISGFSLK